MPMPVTFPPARTASPFTSMKGDHAAIRVPDFDAAVSWYTEKLDFRVMHTWPYGELKLAYLALAVDDVFRLELLAGPGAADRPPSKDLGDSLGYAGWHHICLRVDGAIFLNSRKSSPEPRDPEHVLSTLRQLPN